MVFLPLSQSWGEAGRHTWSLALWLIIHRFFPGNPIILASAIIMRKCHFLRRSLSFNLYMKISQQSWMILRLSPCPVKNSVWHGLKVRSATEEMWKIFVSITSKKKKKGTAYKEFSYAHIAWNKYPRYLWEQDYAIEGDILRAGLASWDPLVRDWSLECQGQSHSGCSHSQVVVTSSSNDPFTLLHL